MDHPGGHTAEVDLAHVTVDTEHFAFGEDLVDDLLGTADATP
ncbi:hypothetical protein ACU639_00285 [Streptomyces cynarae]